MNRLLRRRPKPSPAPRPSHAADRHSTPAVAPRTLVVVPPAPPVVPSARPDDPTPIFDAVMTDKWWGDFHALETQFEVAFALDEFDDDELEEIRREVVEDVDFGWGES